MRTIGTLLGIHLITITFLLGLSVFKHKIVRRLGILLIIKLIAVFTIKYSFFNEPVIDHGEIATDKVSVHFMPENNMLKNQ